MLKHYIEHVKSTEQGVEKLLLICKTQLIPLYTKAGFTLVGPSEVVWGTAYLNISTLYLVSVITYLFSLFHPLRTLMYAKVTLFT